MIYDQTWWIKLVECLIKFQFLTHISTTLEVSFIRGVRFLQCFSFCRGFQDYQILFASVYAPFISVAHVDLDTKDKGTHMSLCWLVCFNAPGIVSPSSFQSHNVLHLSCRNLCRLSCYGIQKGGPNLWNRLLLVGSSRWGLFDGLEAP